MSSSSNGGTNGSSQPYEARRPAGQNELDIPQHEGIVKVIEVLAESPHSWEDAAFNALNEAEASIRNIKSIYVKDMQAIVHRGEIVRWRLNAKISFAVNSHEQASRGRMGEKSSRPSETHRQGGRIMERMEEGRRQYRDDREEGRERYESQEESRYRGQGGGYRASEDEGRRGGSEGWEQGEYGRNQNMGWRYGGEEGSRSQSGGYGGMSHQGSREPSYRQSEYGGGEHMGRSGQSSGGQYGGGYGGSQSSGGQYGRGQYGRGQYGRGQQGGGSSSRFGGQETGGQYVGRQYRSGQLGGFDGGQYGGGQSGGGYSGYSGGPSGMYGGGQYGGQSGNRQYGGGRYGQGGQYGIERQGYFGEGGMGQRSYQGEEQGHDESLGHQLSEFGGAMAGRVRRMFRGPKGYKRSDDRIREDVCDILSQVEEVDPTEIEVSVSGGEVTLSGSVPERSMKWQAEQIVDNVHGVSDINNQLRVKRYESSPSMGTGGMGGMGSSTSTGQTGQAGQTGKGSTARS